MAACLLVVIASASATAAAGLSMGLGAFVAGLLLAETEYRREVEVTIEPFKGLLLGLFFVTTGAGLDLRIAAAAPLRILALVAALVAIKAVVIFVLARAMRIKTHAALETALVLAPGGEFALVMLAAAASEKILPAAEGAQLMVAVTLSMLTIPLFGALVARASKPPQIVDPALANATPAPGAGRIIVVGYGRVGQLVCEMLRMHDKQFVAIDGKPDLVGRERQKGVEVYWGDARRVEFLRRCGIADAAAIVVTLDSPRAAEEVVALARKERPDIVIIARARDAHHATALYTLGATDAIPETIEASLQLSEAVLVDIGVPMGFVIASIHAKRDDYRALLAPAAGTSSHRAVRQSTRLRRLGKRDEPRFPEAPADAGP